MRSDEVKSVLQSGHRLLVISEGGHHEQSWRREGCPLFDVVHPALPLPTAASRTLQGAPKEGVGEAVTGEAYEKVTVHNSHHLKHKLLRVCYTV